LKPRREDLAHVGAEYAAVGRADDRRGCERAAHPDRADDRDDLSVPAGHFRDDTLAPRSPATRARHARLRPRVVQEDEPHGIDTHQVVVPHRPTCGDVGPILLLRGVGRLFLSGSPSRLSHLLID
jgi:hypothetical protein